MYLVGLTGGIAAGKSTVAKRWVELGGVEIDADQLAREVVSIGQPALLEIQKQFGDAVVINGQLDRKALGQIVFNDAAARIKLEAITHPRIRDLAAAKLAELPADAIAIYNVPLLVEAKVDMPFDYIVTVEAPREKQLERLTKIRGLSEADALARIDAGANPAERANVADEILNSNQSIELLLKDADLAWRRIQQRAVHGID